MRIRPAAFVLMDALVATALMGVLLTASLAVMSSMSHARHATDSRAIAIELAASALERVRALSWNEITRENLNRIAHSSSAGTILPGAAMNIEFESAAGAPAARHVWVEISWTQATGGAIAPVRLDYWAYAPEGVTP